MGGKICRKPPKKYDPTPDPTTGLTQRDRELISITWMLALERKTLKNNAVELFMQLFESYPETQERFELFKDTPWEELRTNPKLRAHATSVFYALTSYVENMEDSETLLGLAQKISVSHVRKNISSDDFDKFRTVFPTFLKYLLKDKFTEEIEQAWDKLLRAQIAIFTLTEEEMLTKKGKQ